MAPTVRRSRFVIRINPMLTCVYHPIDEMQVVEAEEAELMKASGIWFDSPLKAKQYRKNVEKEIENESKLKGKSNEEIKHGRVK
jgi:hypothetical protein